MVMPEINNREAIMHTATVIPFSPHPQSSHRFTREERDAIITGAMTICPTWGVEVNYSDDGDVASIGPLAGGSKHWDAADAYGMAFVSGRRIDLADLRTFAGIGTFPTVAEAVAAMVAHAKRQRH